MQKKTNKKKILGIMSKLGNFINKSQPIVGEFPPEQRDEEKIKKEIKQPKKQEKKFNLQIEDDEKAEYDLNDDDDEEEEEEEDDDNNEDKNKEKENNEESTNDNDSNNEKKEEDKKEEIKEEKAEDKKEEKDKQETKKEEKEEKQEIKKEEKQEIKEEKIEEKKENNNDKKEEIKEEKANKIKEEIKKEDKKDVKKENQKETKKEVKKEAKKEKDKGETKKKNDSTSQKQKKETKNVNKQISKINQQNKEKESKILPKKEENEIKAKQKIKFQKKPKITDKSKICHSFLKKGTDIDIKEYDFFVVKKVKKGKTMLSKLNNLGINLNLNIKLGGINKVSDKLNSFFKKKPKDIKYTDYYLIINEYFIYFCKDIEVFDNEPDKRRIGSVVPFFNIKKIEIEKEGDLNKITFEIKYRTLDKVKEFFADNEVYGELLEIFHEYKKENNLEYNIEIKEKKIKA